MKSKDTEIVIDYKIAQSNHMRNNVEEAVHSFIQGDIGYSLTLFPQALNPFLKSLESMGAWRKALVIPYFDSKNKPLYIVLKVDGELKLRSVKLSGGGDIVGILHS